MEIVQAQNSRKIKAPILTFSFVWTSQRIVLTIKIAIIITNSKY